MKKYAHLISGLILAAIGALAAIKTFAELAVGSDVSAQRVAFYVGASALFIYISASISVVATSSLFALLDTVFHYGDEGDKLLIPVIIFTLMIGLVFTAWLGSVLEFGYQIHPFLRGLVAFVGLAAIVGTVYLFRRSSKSSNSSTAK